MKSFRVFYTFSGAERSLSPEAAIVMTEADIYSEMLGSLAEDGDFFGLIDARGTTLQVMYEAKDGTFWVETPRPQEGGSYGVSLTFDQVNDLFKALPSEFSPASLPCLKFRSWRAEGA